MLHFDYKGYSHIKAIKSAKIGTILREIRRNSETILVVLQGLVESKDDSFPFRDIIPKIRKSLKENSNALVIMDAQKDWGAYNMYKPLYIIHSSVKISNMLFLAEAYNYRKFDLSQVLDDTEVDKTPQEALTQGNGFVFDTALKIKLSHIQEPLTHIFVSLEMYSRPQVGFDQDYKKMIRVLSRHERGELISTIKSLESKVEDGTKMYLPCESYPDKDLFPNFEKIIVQ